jgi:hypothetical protein
MPPRARILPASMQKGYRNTQVFKHALMKVGLQTLGATAVSGGCCEVTQKDHPLLMSFFTGQTRWNTKDFTLN